MINRWLEVTADLDPAKRLEFAAANVVFAELTGCQDEWKRLVGGLEVVTSRYLESIKNDGIKEGIKEGTRKGAVEARADLLLRGLRRLGTVPGELEATIRACTDADKLDIWLDLVFDRPTIEEFRRQAGI